MSTKLSLLTLLAAWVIWPVHGAAQTFDTYSNETVFLTMIDATSTLSESFEREMPWGGVRSTIAGGTHAASSVVSGGIRWQSNHPANQITTGEGTAFRGSWSLYSIPHGDQSAAADHLRDGFKGSSAAAMTAVGGWFTGSPGGQLAVALDGGPEIALGPIGTDFRFYGVVVAGGSFGEFEFRETEGTLEDQKLLFADALTVAGDFSAAARAMDGAVAGVANILGAQGSDWHTDLFLYNASAEEIRVELSFNPNQGAVSPPVAQIVCAGCTMALDDAVGRTFATQGSGAILWRVVSGDDTALSVNANTYNRIDETRRYGQQIQGIRRADAIPVGWQGAVFGITADDHTRSNLILQNACTGDDDLLTEATATVTVVDRLGTAVAGWSYQLGAGEYRQHNHFLPDYGLGWLAGGTLLIGVEAAPGSCTRGGVMAMVSEVNGAALEGTNDGRLIQASVNGR